VTPPLHPPSWVPKRCWIGWRPYVVGNPGHV
jgi:hypothetical protein